MSSYEAAVIASAAYYANVCAHLLWLCSLRHRRRRPRPEQDREEVVADTLAEVSDRDGKLLQLREGTGFLQIPTYRALASPPPALLDLVQGVPPQ